MFVSSVSFIVVIPPDLKTHPTTPVPCFIPTILSHDSIPPLPVFFSFLFHLNFSRFLLSLHSFLSFSFFHSFFFFLFFAFFSSVFISYTFSFFFSFSRRWRGLILILYCVDFFLLSLSRVGSGGTQCDNFVHYGHSGVCETTVTSTERKRDS